MAKTQPIRPQTGDEVCLKDYDPAYRGRYRDKEETEEELAALRKRLRELQNVLYAEHRHALLIVLQAMDAGGKDGTIRHVMRGVNPQGVRVTSFKAPTPDELDHDFLWRIHPHVPGKGMIGIFNRSHYEDVLVVRVAKLAPENVWEARYDHINAFERLLADSGVVILKFFLHISKQEQKERFLARLEEPDKRWKFSKGGPGRARAMGRLYARLRGRPDALQHALGAVAYHPGRSQVVPEPRHRANSGRNA